MGTPRVAVAKHAKEKILTAYRAGLASLASCQDEAAETIEAHAVVQCALDGGDVYRAALLLINSSVKQRARDEQQVRLIAYLLDQLDDIEGIEEQVDPAAIRLVEELLQGRPAA